jgi:hypothetical protein
VLPDCSRLFATKLTYSLKCIMRKETFTVSISMWQTVWWGIFLENFLVSQVVLALCDWKFHYRLHISPPLVPIMNHLNRVPTFTTSFFSIYFNNILIYTLYLPMRFFDKNWAFISPMHATCLDQPFWLNQQLLNEQQKKIIRLISYLWLNDGETAD